MKPIFNSLGSNYSFNFVKFAFKQIFFSDRKNLIYLHQYLEKNYGGESFLFHKGRDAIEFSLRVLFSRGSILTQAFSCFAVEEGIKRAGMKPIYVDVSKDSTNMTVETLEKAFLENNSKKIRAVLVQHSLGIPADILAIKKFCQKNDLILIEDLAQSVGGTDNLGQPLGKHADVIIFSFGRDKIVDAISGGAVIFKHLTIESSGKINSISISELPRNILISEMLYPLITYLGRNSYSIFIGKFIIKLATGFKLISSPTMSKTKSLTKMHPGYAKLAIISFDQLKQQIENRRKIAQHYFNYIDNKNIEIINSKNDIKFGSNLRFSIRTDRVNELIQTMKKHQIYLSDRWYRSAVDCGKLKCNSDYQDGLAVNAEKLAVEIVNLPTHQNISTEKADRIIKLINEF